MILRIHNPGRGKTYSLPDPHVKTGGGTLALPGRTVNVRGMGSTIKRACSHPGLQLPAINVTGQSRGVRKRHFPMKQVRGSNRCPIKRREDIHSNMLKTELYSDRSSGFTCLLKWILFKGRMCNLFWTSSQTSKTFFPWKHETKIPWVCEKCFAKNKAVK